MSIDYTIPDGAYVPTEAERAGIKAFMKANDNNTSVWDALKEIDPSLEESSNLPRQDIIRQWLNGWDLAETQYLCSTNNSFAERIETTTFQPGKILTLKVKVVEKFQTDRLFDSMYSPEHPTIAGCVVEAIGFSDYMGELEQLRKDLAKLANPSTESTFPRMIT